jgi:site-specific DNA recombinase
MSLIEAARDGEFDVILSYSLDRLTRDTDDFGWLKRELRRAGVGIDFVTGSKEQIIQVVESVVAQSERAQIRERSKRGKESTAQRGTMLAAHAPYGYRHRYDKVGRVDKVVGLDEDLVTGPIARRIFQFLADGGSMTGIANRLNEEGVPAPRGMHWRASSITSILQNPIYRGDAYALRFEGNRSERTRKRTMRNRPDEAWVRLPECVAPALVSPDVWRKANEQRVKGRAFSRKNNPEPELYLLRAGFIRCGYCGQTLTALRGSNGVPTYICKRTARDGCPSSGSIRASDIDQEVWWMVLRILQDPTWIRQHATVASNTGARRDEVQSRLQAYRRQEARLAATIGDLDDPSPVIKRMNALTREIETLQREADELAFQQKQASQVVTRLRDLHVYLQEIDRLDQLTYDEKRAVLREFDVQVTLWKKDHEPRWALDWAFDIPEDWWLDADMEGEAQWVVYTHLEEDLLYRSSA